MQQIRDYLNQLNSDEALRKFYEEQRQSEQTRIRNQIEAETRERDQIKAMMDARVEAEISGGTTPSGSLITPAVPETSTDLSWLDAFLASLDNQPSYDQGASSSSPVVNTDGTLPSGTSETTAPAIPSSTEEEATDTDVTQYDPAFYLDFVCTCVNCHVQALPVELDANNVLLVDASVIEPGTYLNVEGYGMVVARASDGYTSGQTAVLYSNSHSAVNRFSSGTYNVYKVVG